MIGPPPRSPLFPSPPLSRFSRAFPAALRRSPPALAPLCRCAQRKLELGANFFWRRHAARSEEHTSELQSLAYLVCRLLLEKKKKKDNKVFSAMRNECLYCEC